MRRLTILVAVMALIYSAYWFIGATATERGARGALDNLTQQGWDISYDSLNTRGFPSRFDTTFDEIDLSAPDGSIRFSAPFVQTMSLSYQPNHVIAAFPERQVLTLGGQEIVIEADRLRASGGVAANTALSLDMLTAEVGAAVLTSNFGWDLALDSGLLALREKGPQAFSYDAYINADGVALPSNLIALFDPTNAHPAKITTVVLDTTLTLDRGLDRHSLAEIERDPPLLTAVELNKLTVNWGEMSLTGDGQFVIGTDGRPEGEITIRASEWRAMIDLLRSAELIQPGLLTMAEGFATSLSGGATQLELPITFRDGIMLLGPLPVGPAPKFY